MSNKYIPSVLHHAPGDAPGRAATLVLVPVKAVPDVAAPGLLLRVVDDETVQRVSTTELNLIQAHDLWHVLAEWIAEQVKPVPMKWRRLADGSYRSNRGYVILPNGTDWVSNRSDAEPIPGLNTHSALEWAQQNCDRDWTARVTEDPRLLAEPEVLL